MSPARVLLLGGAGCLGAHAARALRAAGHQVTVLARAPHPGIDADEAIRADRRDAGALVAALESRRFDLTVDFLAYDAADVERLFHAAHAGLGHYVLISTGQVYLVAAGAEPPFRESARERPLQPEPAGGTPDHAEWSYGAGKRRAEESVQALAATHGVHATVLRLPIVQGAGDRTLRLWAWLERMLDGGPVLLPDAGARPVRFVWAGDVARALVHLAGSPPPPSPAYNLAQPDVLPLREFLERVARAAGLAPRFVDVSWEEVEAAGIPRETFPYAGRWVSVIDPGLAAAELGLEGTGVAGYLPQVVSAHLERRPERSHPGFSLRPRELALTSHAGAGARLDRAAAGP